MEKEEEVSRNTPLAYDVDQHRFDVKGEGRTKAQSLGDSCKRNQGSERERQSEQPRDQQAQEEG